MNRFVHSGRHAAMLADMAGRLGQSTFVESSTRPNGLPLDWAPAKQRLTDAHRPPSLDMPAPASEIRERTRGRN